MKKYLLFVVVFLSLLLSFRFIILTFRERSYKENYNPYTIRQSEFLNLDRSKILAGQKRTLEFKSNYSNLGSVEILIDNHNKINKDEITFRIKEKGGIDWLYQNNYKTSAMDIGQYFPFGFEAIKDSKNKSYVIELESLRGSESDAISLSANTRHMNIKYLYNRDFLNKKLYLIPQYLNAKVGEFIKLFSFKDFVTTVLIFIFPTFIYILFTDPKYGKFFKAVSFSRKFKFSVRKELLILLSFYFVTHLQFVNYRQYWDSDWYWQLLLSAVDSLNSFKNGGILEFIKLYVSSFNFLGHPSMFYASFLAIGQLLDYGNVTILNLQNILFAMLGISGFYCLCLRIFGENKYENILLTVLFAFNPLFYATTISLNTDVPILISEIFLVLAILNNNKKLFLLWSLAMIFSKETGILMYLSIAFSFLFIFKYKRSILNKNFLLEILFYLIPLLVFATYLYFTGGNMHSYDSVTNTGNSLRLVWDDNGFFTFGLNSKNVLVRFFQIAIMNFNWIMFLFIMSGVIKSIVLGVNMLDKYKSDAKDEIRFILYSSIPFVVLTFLFITMNFARYVVPITFYYYLLSYICLRFLVKKRGVRILILSVVCILNIIQTYRSIDPSPYLLYGKNYIGENISSPVFGYRDGMVYNSQFVFVDVLSRQIEEEIGSKKVIIDSSAEYFFKNIKQVDTVNHIEKIKEIELVYVYIPWFDNPREGLNKIKSFYLVTDQKKIEYKGYFIYLYNLKRIK